MLNLLSKVVAPDVAPVQDLRHQWNMFLDYYSTKQTCQLKSEPIEQTKLTFHLNKMLKLVVEDQQKMPGGHGMSPSLEYVLQNNVLDTLVTLCQADSPPGIRPYIFNVFIFLLEKVRYPLMPETACHQPMRRLVLICTLTKASPTEGQEIKFLTILCGKIRSSPDLIHIFLEQSISRDGAVTPGSFDRSREASGRVSRDNSLDLVNIERLAINVREALDSLQNKHLLASALLHYLDSADYLLTCTAMESLCLVTMVDSDLAAKTLVMDSPFLGTLVSRLASLYSAIPSSVDTTRVEEIVVSWVQVHHYQAPELEDPSFVGRAELLAFFSFLDYLDQLVRQSHSFVSQSLATEIKDQFLARYLEPKLTSDQEADMLLGLALMAQFWLHIKSDKLAHSFSVWLLGENIPDSDQHPLKARLMETCSKGGLVGLETVRTLDVLLSSPCQYIIDRMVTVHLETRGYHLTSAHPESIINSWSDVEDEREKMENVTASEAGVSETVRSVLAPSRTLAPSNIHRLVNSWLYLMPDILKLDEVRGSGYDHYVTDAGKQVETVARECAGFDWPREATGGWDASDAASSDSRVEADPSRGWSEGLFLSTLLDLLCQCLDNDYDTNLQLTSVISRLAQLPHPHLHEYLLNPTIPLNPNVRTLFTVLKDVLSQAVTRSEAIPHFPLKMIACRRKLLGDKANIGGGRDIEMSPEERTLLEAILVLDEFCKELAAVTFVKYQCFA